MIGVNGFNDLPTHRHHRGSPRPTHQSSFGPNFGGQPQWAPAPPRGPQQPYPGVRPHGPSGQFPVHQPHFRGHMPAPPSRKPSIVPGVLIVVVAVVAVLSVVALTRGGPGGGPTGPQFRNEDYSLPPLQDQVPDVPRPTTQQEVVDWLEGNALYQHQLPQPVRCEIEHYDVITITEPELVAALDKVLDCTLRVWGPTLEQAGFINIRPRLHRTAIEVQTACGKMGTGNAMMCQNDQSIYYSYTQAELLQIYGPMAHVTFLLEATMAHEFGHLVQARSGILSADILLMKQASSEAEAYAIRRRTEAQAECFAGLFFNTVRISMSLTEDDLSRLQQRAMIVGGPAPQSDESRSHPSGEPRKRWLIAGLNSLDVGACNTWTVPVTEVT